MAVVSLLVALVILSLAVPPSEPPVGERRTAREEQRAVRSQRRLYTYGVAFWVLVVATITAAIFGNTIL
jgi:hypothetical protein